MQSIINLGNANKLINIDPNATDPKLLYIKA